MNIRELKEKPIWQMTGEELLCLLQSEGIKEQTATPVILRVEDSIVGTLGNFSASTGKAKSKKTFNVCAIVASALTNSVVLNYAASLPDNKRKILYTDTEQSKFHCQRVLKRILQLAELPTDKQPEALEFLSLRKFSPKIRMGIIEEAIYHTEGLGLVIIDGVRDLAYDINSPSEATDLITKLMWYYSPFRNETEASFKVNLSRNEWYDFGTGKGGDILKFVMEQHGINDVSKALHIISGETPKIQHSFSFRPQDNLPIFEDIRILENPICVDPLNQNRFDP